MAGFSKADVNLLTRIEKRLRSHIELEEKAAGEAARAIDAGEHFRERDRLLRDEREVQVLRERIRLHLPPAEPKTAAA